MPRHQSQYQQEDEGTNKYRIWRGEGVPEDMVGWTLEEERKGARFIHLRILSTAVSLLDEEMQS